jgi:hypothetical protein
MLLALLLVPQQPQETRGIITSAGGRVTLSLELTLAAPVQLPDGRQLGASVRIPSAPSAEPWFVYSRGHFCDSSITRGSVPADVTEGWRISIVERSRTDQQMFIAVTWLRMWERGRLVTAGSGGTSELTLKSGDRVPLDQITRPSVPADCAATQKTLELQVAMRVTAPAGMVSATTGPTSTEPNAPLDGPVTAELWMVHQLPNGIETVQRQTVRLPEGGVGFLFRGSPVESAEGPMVIEVSGQLRAVIRADGTRGLWTGFARSVVHQATGRRYSGSGGDKAVDWLTPGDVISFDLPTPSISPGFSTQTGGRGGGVATGGTGAAGGIVSTRSGGSGGARATTVPRGPNLLEGHRLSVRIRLIETK